MIKKIKNIFNKVINDRKYKRAIKGISSNSEATKLYIDLGSSYIKASIDNEYISFRSSVRVANNNEITIQSNYLNLNGTSYILEENNVDIGNYTFKHDKLYLNVLVAYAIKLLSEKVQINVNNIELYTMLPFSQISNNKLSKVLNGIYTIKDIKGNIINCNVTLKYTGVEGELSYSYFNAIQNNKCDNTIVLNFGNSTIDLLTMCNKTNSRQGIQTINQGTNMLFPNYLQYLPHIPNSSLLGSFLQSGKFRFTKEEEQNIHRENLLYLKTILFDIENQIRRCNPYSLNIIVCGGGAVVLFNAIKELLGDRYNIILPDSESCVFSDLKGLKIVSGVNIDNNNIAPPEDEEEAPEEEERVIDIKKPRNNTFEDFCRLREENYSLKQIYNEQLLPLSYNTLKNYNVKYKKILKAEEQKLLLNNQIELAI